MAADVCDGGKIVLQDCPSVQFQPYVGTWYKKEYRPDRDAALRALSKGHALLCNDVVQISRKAFLFTRVRVSNVIHFFLANVLLIGYFSSCAPGAKVYSVCITGFLTARYSGFLILFSVTTRGKFVMS